HPTLPTRKRRIRRLPRRHNQSLHSRPIHIPRPRQSNVPHLVPSPPEQPLRVLEIRPPDEAQGHMIRVHRHRHHRLRRPLPPPLSPPSPPPHHAARIPQ